ncbi:MAG: hypothetical protein ABFD79_10930 [Phycisphaerales bacterium]
MGLINNFLVFVVHLLLLIIDILLVMIAAKVIYDRFEPSWLKQAVKAVEPIIDYMLNYVKNISARITGETFSERTLMLLIIICLSLVRLLTL